ncbi:uncharacterized protein PHACADRAFT_84386 [Phanerochaete carnosa HHB-10118-sp]|uniref:Histone deacetylase complex subunit SAP30 Sin3 binding domain-containing protein n=1 Tax=Phanerochaete carnosa (strain HHB-10118-sp) TaxID=650164 RepID=K5VBZ8_PHACS|nr:uncharacterized protein PHACADRAFT_84386 [Phanerochaete carnosa HHB-10118-sp]EKM60441.1 hypothetical protein PHACADRAFT_84386 [Phanerochaete carnosa HHB-10118-sp]
MAPPGTSVLAATSQPPAATSRARPQARRKANPQDDAAYHGALPSSAGAKRSATDKADGEPRVKRKRLEPAVPIASSGNASMVARKPNDRGVDFSKMSIEAIHRYLVEYDIVPELSPLPTTALDPPPPSYLLRPRGQRASTASPAPAPLPPTPANRPRREPSASANRRRSSRLLDEDELPNGIPILADVGEVHKALAQIAQKHFQEYHVKEVETLASFMCVVKAKGERQPWQMGTPAFWLANRWLPTNAPLRVLFVPFLSASNLVSMCFVFRHARTFLYDFSL